MNPLDYSGNEPVFALATPWGESAVSVIRISGEGSLALLAPLFSAPERLRSARSHTLLHGALGNGSGEPLDEVLIAVFAPGRGYTGEEAAEIYCHGSLPGIQSLMEALREAGFRDAEAGEFTLRAFLNGRLDLTQAEAVAEIVSSRSRTAHSMALHRLSGSIGQRIDGFKSVLTRILGSVEIQLDYAEDEVEVPVSFDAAAVEEVRAGLETLASSYSTGRLYRDGARIALSGRTNAGKSSLFNLFVREDRSIVSDIHGTTRDFVHEELSIRGIPVTIYDTAGLRGDAHTGAADPVETEGIRRSGAVTESADLVLYLVDGLLGAQPGELDGLVGEKTILVWSKADVAEDPPEGFLPVSSLTGSGFTELEAAVAERLGAGEAPAAGAIIDSARQRDLLQRAAAALAQALSGAAEGVPLDAVAVDLRDALDALGEITGEVTTTEILQDMFSRFCVGK